MNIYDQMLDGWSENQWTKNTSGPQKQCLGGRLAKQLGYNFEPAIRVTPEWKHLTDAIRNATSDQFIGVQQWNDQPDRTFTDIQTILAIASIHWDLAHQPQEQPA